MERLAWDLHQMIRDLCSITIDTNENQVRLQGCQVRIKQNSELSLQTPAPCGDRGWYEKNDSLHHSYEKRSSDSHNIFALRRVLRRIGHTLQQLEKEIMVFIEDQPTMSNELRPLNDQKYYRESDKSINGTENLSQCCDADSRSHHRRHDVHLDSQASNSTGEQQFGGSSRVLIWPSKLQKDLLVILTDLPLTMYDTNALQYGILALEIAARIWLIMNESKSAMDQHQQITSESLQHLLDRILEYEKQNEFVMSENKGSSYELIKPLASWMEVVNHHFLMFERKWEEQQQYGSPLDPIALFQYAQEFVARSTVSIQMKHWEISNVGDPVTETFVQWRIFTCRLLTRFSTSFVRTEDPVQMEDFWNVFIEDYVATSNALEHGGPNQKSIQYQQFSHQVNEFMTCIETYASELTSFAMDAVDGATVATFQTSKSDSVHTPGMSNLNVSIQVIVQDCLRHVALAVDILVVSKAWFDSTSSDTSHLSQAKRSLWKSLSSAFLGSSSLQQQNIEKETKYGTLLCEYMLVLTKEILENSSHDCFDDDSTLILVFLRLMDFPNTLLSESANCLWIYIEKITKRRNTREHGVKKFDNDVRHVLQTAYLTLRGSRVGEQCAIDKADIKKSDTQAVLDKLSEILLAQDSFDQGPWDEFFMNQITSFEDL